MDKQKIAKKFGGKKYQVDNDTFVIGIHYLLGECIARKFNGYGVILDTCCGAGFMSIALAKYVNRVIAVDVDLNHLEQAKNNIRIAGFSHKVDFILGDILSEKILNKIPVIDGAFLDPDWAIKGNPKRFHTSKLSDMQPPADKLFSVVNKRTENIVFRLPKEMELSELELFPSHSLKKIYLDDDFKFYCAYFGKLAEMNNTESRIFTK